MTGRMRPSGADRHEHRASCHGPAGELQCSSDVPDDSPASETLLLGDKDLTEEIRAYQEEYPTPPLSPEVQKVGRLILIICMIVVGAILVSCGIAIIADIWKDILS